MAANSISVEYLRECLAPDFANGLLVWKNRPLSHFQSPKEWKRWNARYAGMGAFTKATANGYTFGTLKKTVFAGHRVLMAMQLGRWPTMVDHINGERSDNRAENLREVTPSENARNMALNSRNTSGKPGVCWIKADRKWRAHMSLGIFDTKEEAIAARGHAEVILGNFHENHGRPLSQIERAKEKVNE